MSLKISPTEFLGCWDINFSPFVDHRGSFVKIFHSTAFTEMGIEVTWREQFWSTSGKGVLRGFHFQSPPADHAKLVFCTSGKVHDVALDIRKKSQTFGESLSRILTPQDGNGLFIPKGMAHAFQALEDNSTLVYLVETVHSSKHDLGIRWNSCQVAWSVENPIVSKRDASFPALADFDSPFF